MSKDLKVTFDIPASTIGDLKELYVLFLNGKQKERLRFILFSWWQAVIRNSSCLDAPALAAYNEKEEVETLLGLDLSDIPSRPPVRES